MKICHLVPHWSPYNEKRLVGIKRIISYLFREQLKMDHDVYLIAPTDSEGDEKRIIKTIPSLKQLGISVYDPRHLYYGYVHGSLIARYSSQFDILHSHIEHILLPFLPLIKTPVLSTIHGTDFNQDELFVFRQFYGRFFSVGISKKSIELNQKNIKFNDQIYNGVDTKDYRFNPQPNQDYMFLIARINHSKGIIEAIETANCLKKKLIIRGFKETGKEDYFNQVVAQSSKSSYVDFNPKPIFGLSDKWPLYANAKLFLSPTNYEETFASTIIESLACGTPIVAFARGSLVEQIVDGKTGFLVNPSDRDIRGNWLIKKTGISGLIEAVQKIYNLDDNQYQKMRKNCRQQVEKKFSLNQMVDRYLSLYQKLIDENKRSV